MYGFGDELSIESYRIPWLICIQLLILVLLVFLLHCFTLVVQDHSDNTGTSTSTSQLVSNETQINKPIPKRNTTTIVTNCLETSQVGERVIKGEIATSRSRRLVREGEDVTEREGSSATHKCHHPCDFFRQARIAFLKCLGLDSIYENSSASD